MSHISPKILLVSYNLKDNEIYFEFHSFLCFVEDVVIEGIVLKGTLKDSLYQFPLLRLSSSTNVYPPSILVNHQFGQLPSPFHFTFI